MILSSTDFSPKLIWFSANRINIVTETKAQDTQ